MGEDYLLLWVLHDIVGGVWGWDQVWVDLPTVRRGVVCTIGSDSTS